MENKHKQFKCKDEILLKYKKDESAIWFYAVFSSYYKDAIIASGGLKYNIDSYDVLPFKGNEHLVGTTNEPQIPLSEKELQDVYWNGCTEQQKLNLRLSYNGFSEGSEARSILEKTCGKHNLQGEPEEEVKLEKGEWVMVPDGGGSFNNALQWHLSKFFRTITVNDEENFHVATGLSIADCLYAVKFSNFNPNNMEETRKHILCVKNGRIVKYKK